MAHVVILARDPDIARQAGAILAAADHHAVMCEDGAEFERQAVAALTGVIVVPWIELDDWRTWLAVLAEEHPALSLVLITNNHPENLRLLGELGVRFRAVLYPSDLDRLPAVVAPDPFETFFTAVVACIRAARHLPLTLRRVLLDAVNQRPAAEPVSKLDQGAPARSVVALATRLGYSADYLSQLAAASGIYLGRFIRWCVVLRALELMLVDGVKEEQAAWRMGFEYTSGLSDFVLRTAGMRPSKAGFQDAPGLVACFEEEFVAGLGAGATGEHGRPPERSTGRDLGE